MSTRTIWLLISVLCIFIVFQVQGEVDLSKHKLGSVVKWKYEKRPFCNAFTGCGKKRSPYPPYPYFKRSEFEGKPYISNNYEADEELSDLIDINAEPAVENVQKQIMSQAKIYEAIKEASKEIYRQKNKQKLLNQLRLEQRKQQQLMEQQKLPQEHNDQMDDGEMV